jgi:pyrimidine operon attenuation protein/uracil phosphoribosyltransferase
MVAKQFKINVTKIVVRDVLVSTRRIKAAFINTAVRARPISIECRKGIGYETLK